MNSVELTNKLTGRERNDRCSKCRYCHRITDSVGWTFLACRQDPYHGKWVIEIEHCPLENEKDV